MTSSPNSMRRLGRASVVYGLGAAVGRAASIVMLPIYTRLLTPGDYGILQMLDLTIDVIALLLSAGATAGVMRFYYKSDSPEERKSILGSAFLMLTGLNTIGGLLMALLAPAIMTHLLGPTATPTMVYLSAANFAVGAISIVPLLLLQMQERAMLFTMLNVGRLVVQLTLNVVLLVVFRMGPLGILTSNLVASSLMAIVTSVLFVRGAGFRISWEAVRRLQGFAIPYQVTMAGAFILTFGNRFFIKKYFGIDQVGIYGLAFQFGFLLASLTSAPILRAWTPQRHQFAKLPREERDVLYNNGMIFLSAVTIAAAAGIALFVEPVLMIMSDPAFRGAALVVPLVVLAYVLQAWSDSFMFNFDVGERPTYITIGTWISVVISLGLFAVLVPRWGVMGAAVSTVIAFAVRLAIYWAWSTRVWPVSLNWRPHGFMLLAAAGAYLTYRGVAPGSLVTHFAVASGSYLGFLALLAWAAPPESRAQLVGLLGGTVARLRRMRSA